MSLLTKWGPLGYQLQCINTLFILNILPAQTHQRRNSRFNNSNMQEKILSVEETPSLLSVWCCDGDLSMRILKSKNVHKISCWQRCNSQLEIILFSFCSWSNSSHSSQSHNHFVVHSRNLAPTDNHSKIRLPKQEHVFKSGGKRRRKLSCRILGLWDCVWEDESRGWCWH